MNRANESDHTYVALKPVRFDKDYIIGEIIPDKVLDPASIKRLIDNGRIAAIGEAKEYDPESVVAQALESLVVFLEQSLEIEYDDIEYDDIERENQSIYNRVEVCKAGLTQLIQTLRESTEAPRVDDENGGGTISPLDGKESDSGEHGANVGHDNNQKSHQCTKCDKTFDSQAALNAHMRSHR